MPIAPSALPQATSRLTAPANCRMDNKGRRLRHAVAIDCASVEDLACGRRDQGRCNTPQRERSLEAAFYPAPQEHFALEQAPQGRKQRDRTRLQELAVTTAIFRSRHARTDQSVFPQGILSGGTKSARGTMTRPGCGVMVVLASVSRSAASGSRKPKDTRMRATSCMVITWSSQVCGCGDDCSIAANRNRRITSVTMTVTLMRCSFAATRTCCVALLTAQGNRDQQAYTKRPAAMVCADDRAEDFVTAWLKFGASEAAESV
jgi:hypothetical protein